MSWPCPSHAHRQPLTWQGLSLPKASGWLLGRLLHGWSCSLVLPWKCSRLILFTASRTPKVLETDGNRLMLGSFPSKRVFLARQVPIRGLAAIAKR